MAKTIMIVDNSTSLREVVSIALKGALSKLDGRKLHLIFIDVNMPNHRSQRRQETGKSDGRGHGMVGQVFPACTAADGGFQTRSAVSKTGIQ